MQNGDASLQLNHGCWNELSDAQREELDQVPSRSIAVGSAGARVFIDLVSQLREEELESSRAADQWLARA